MPTDRRTQAATEASSTQFRTTGSVPQQLSDSKQYIGRFTDGDGPCVYRCKSPQRRNWSIVSRGEIENSDGATRQVFLKQFIDRSGTALISNFSRELDAHTLALAAFEGCVGVPKIHFVDADNLVIGYELLHIDTFDELLRHDVQRFEQEFTRLLPKLVEILQAMMRAADHAGNSFDQELDRESTKSIVFRGLDVRNIGVLRNVSKVGMQELYIFDFESDYCGSMQDASARLIVSIALLNWGRPVGRFARGPDLDVLNRAIEYLRPYSSPAAIQHRIEKEYSYRMREVKALNHWEAAAKRMGVLLLGRRYFNKLRGYAAKFVV